MRHSDFPLYLFTAHRSSGFRRGNSELYGRSWGCTSPKLSMDAQRNERLQGHKRLTYLNERAVLTGGQLHGANNEYHRNDEQRSGAADSQPAAALRTGTHGCSELVAGGRESSGRDRHESWDLDWQHDLGPWH